jgi:hypothetical protein
MDPGATPNERCPRRLGLSVRMTGTPWTAQPYVAPTTRHRQSSMFTGLAEDGSLARISRLRGHPARRGCVEVRGAVCTADAATAQSLAGRHQALSRWADPAADVPGYDEQHSLVSDLCAIAAAHWSGAWKCRDGAFWPTLPGDGQAETATGFRRPRGVLDLPTWEPSCRGG